MTANQQAPQANLDSPRANPVARNIRVYYVGRIIAAGIGFFVIPLTLRGLGVVDYGIYSLWLVIARWVASFLAGWLQQSILRFQHLYVRNNEFSNYWKTVRLLTLGLGVLSGVIITIVALLASGKGLPFGIAVGLYTVAGVFYTEYFSTAQANQSSVFVILGDSGSNLFVVVATAVLIWLNAFSLEMAFLVLAIGWFLGALIFYVGTIRNQLPPPAQASQPISSFSVTILRRLMVYGLPMAIWFTLSIAQTAVARLSLSRPGMEVSLGQFNATLDFITKITTLLFTPITLSVHPAIMKLWSDGHYKEAGHEVAHSLRLMTALSLATFIGVVIFHPLLMQIIYGEQVEVINQPVIFTVGITLAALLSQMLLIAHKGIEVSDGTLRMSGAMLLSLLTNLILSLGLVQVIGVYGPIIGIFTAYALYFLVTAAMTRRRIARAIAAKLAEA